jgi:hypothetical protein
MKRIKLVLIHWIDKFDNYVLHYLIDRLDRLDRYETFKWVFSLSTTICTKICLSDWWGKEDCLCNYCKSHRDEDI